LLSSNSPRRVEMDVPTSSMKAKTHWGPRFKSAIVPQGGWIP
jgi:hypothetical protein